MATSCGHAVRGPVAPVNTQPIYVAAYAAQVNPDGLLARVECVDQGNVAVAWWDLSLSSNSARSRNDCEHIIASKHCAQGMTRVARGCSSELLPEPPAVMTNSWLLSESSTLDPFHVHMLADAGPVPTRVETSAANRGEGGMLTSYVAQPSLTACNAQRVIADHGDSRRKQEAKAAATAWLQEQISLATSDLLRARSDLISERKKADATVAVRCGPRRPNHARCGGDYWLYYVQAEQVERQVQSLEELLAALQGQNAALAEQKASTRSCIAVGAGVPVGAAARRAP